jgi:enoyl-CoA hydratase/carnithine racemase
MLRLSTTIRRGLSVRLISTLLESHKEFLNVIENQGTGHIQHKHKDHILEITICNPEKKNALSGRMIHQFATLIDELVFSPDYYTTVGLILRGDPAGGAFCAGLDFSTALENSKRPDFSHMMCHLMTDLCTRIQCANVVSVAFVEGYALGGGAELSTACDYRMLTTDSHIGYVHAKLGASPGWGGGRRLYDIVGRPNALRMLGTAHIMNAQQALNIGLATHIVPSFTELEEASQSGAIRDNELHPEAVHAAYVFLNDFASMKYPLAVKDLKALVSSLSVDHTTSPPASPTTATTTTAADIRVATNGASSDTTNRLMEDVHTSILTSSRVAAEKAMFFKRWGSKENADALAGKRKSK